MSASLRGRQDRGPQVLLFLVKEPRCCILGAEPGFVLLSLLWSASPLGQISGCHFCLCEPELTHARLCAPCCR